MNPRHLRNRSAPAHVDIDLVGLQNFIVDHHSVRRLKAGMALNDRTICRSSEPLLHSLVGPRGGCILAGFDSLHIDTHITNGETVFRPSAGNMDRIGACHERFCRDASRIHAGAAKFMAFDNSDGLAGTRKPSCKGRSRLARPYNDCVEVLHRSGQRVPSMWILPSSAASSGVEVVVWWRWIVDMCAPFTFRDSRILILVLITPVDAAHAPSLARRRRTAVRRRCHRLRP